MFDFSLLSGPLGGILAAAFGAGCVAGWGFAMKLMKSRIDDLKADMLREREECREEIKDLKGDIAKLNEFMFNGMQRQLGQVRESGYHILPPSTKL